jgi:hypothetical protein
MTCYKKIILRGRERERGGEIYLDEDRLSRTLTRIFP